MVRTSQSTMVAMKRYLRVSGAGIHRLLQCVSSSSGTRSAIAHAHTTFPRTSYTMPRCSRRYSARLLPRCCLNFSSYEVFHLTRSGTPFVVVSPKVGRFGPNTVGLLRCFQDCTYADWVASDTRTNYGYVHKLSGK